MIRKLSSKFEYMAVLFVSLMEKGLGFLLLFFLARVLSQEDLGWFTAARSIYSIFLPISGLGLGFAYLYFSAKNIQDESKYYSFTVSRGLWLNIIVALVMFCVGVVVIPTGTTTYGLIAVFSLQIIIFFVCDLLRSKDRLWQRNIRYAFNGLVVALIGLIFTVSGAYFYGLVGAVAFGGVGALVTLFLLWGLRVDGEVASSSKLVVSQAFWKYGLGVGFGAFVNQFLMNLDVLVLGLLNIPLAQIALYKVGTLISLQLLIIPNSFFAWKFVALVKSAENNRLLYDELIAYYKWSIPFVVGIALPVGMYSAEILTFLFGVNYGAAYKIQCVFLIAFASGCLLRTPFGTLMNAMGHAHINAMLAYILAPICFAINYWAISAWGIIGAAYAMSASFFISGVASMLVFFIFLHKGVR